MAFFAVSVVSLLLVPVLISTYGLAGFGHIGVARMFLPVTALALLDFGFGEISTQAAARARNDNDWRRASGLLARAATTALVTGAVAGVVLAALSPWVPQWMGLPLSGQPGLSRVLLVTGCLLPLLFLSLVFEGVVKGFERFDAMRSIEVVSALTYAGLALWAAWGSFDENAVCYALLASLCLRATLAGGAALMALRFRGLAWQRLEPQDISWFRAQTRALATNKALGSSQSQLPAVAVGFVLGPVALGIYDALSRLPRAIKGVLGLLSSTVLPLATRLESAADDKGMRRLGQAGVLLVGIVSLPPLAASMVFSRPILQLWLGDSLASLWGWQAALFLVPAMSVLVGFGGAALLVRPHVVRAMNWLTAGQILLQYSVAAMTIVWLQERAFFLGQVLAVGVTFVAQMRLVRKEMDLPRSTYWALARLLVVLLVLAVPGLALLDFVQGWGQLFLAMLSWTLLSWAACARLVLNVSQRERLRRAIKLRLGMKHEES